MSEDDSFTDENFDPSPNTNVGNSRIPQKHDVNNEQGYVEKWNQSIKQLSNEESPTAGSPNTVPMSRRKIVTQDNLNSWVMNFIIVDMLPLNTVEKPGFLNLVSSLAPHLVLHGRTFFTALLETTYQERKQQLIDALLTCTDAATTADAGTCCRKSYLGETIHWFDVGNLQRKSACLVIQRITGRHTFDVLADVIENLHNEFGVTSKLRGTTTDNGSNFLKAFRERGAISTVNDGEDYFDIDSGEEEEDMVYFYLGDILDGQMVETHHNKNFTLPQHRRCACHLLNLVAKSEKKIHEYSYKQLRISLQDDASIMYCQPLLNGLLDTINFRFEHMFCDNELHLATISNPMLKLSWLETEEEIRRGKTLSEDSSDGTSSSRSGPSPEKKYMSAKNFF
ncbi:uncharacterized protein LOC123469455 [Daphnia magna]|uniref:uncharacterized protein LOC123469455 n=1 Tax=Daphnia magna TaxID=35525 RepID=UPI001E1BA257|nr:uncharacterized protein LOC123469455 [Daphnia magna]